MATAEWSKSEKTIARRAFDLAYERESAGLADEVRRRAGRIASLDDVWEIHDFLRSKRKEFDGKYDFRYSELIFVFARLLIEGWLNFLGRAQPLPHIGRRSRGEQPLKICVDSDEAISRSLPIHPDAAINESDKRARRHWRIPCADVPIIRTTKL
ncbi:MAG: hypothetical protein MOB07_10135 [Acidobacteria bacterium]|nr:hypothetical protein [Acidobacteriota bacterium]